MAVSPFTFSFSHFHPPLHLSHCLLNRRRESSTPPCLLSFLLCPPLLQSLPACSTVVGWSRVPTYVDWWSIWPWDLHQELVRHRRPQLSTLFLSQSPSLSSFYSLRLCLLAVASISLSGSLFHLFLVFDSQFITVLFIRINVAWANKNLVCACMCVCVYPLSVA